MSLNENQRPRSGSEEHAEPEPTYRIGAVARLTGVPADTLRVWERRYGVVEPSRGEGGNRLYTRRDIDKLVLLKKLVDLGHAIGSIAGLSVEALTERLSIVAEKRQGADEGARREQGCRVLAVAGDALLGRGTLPEWVQVVASFRDQEALLAAEAPPEADVLLVSLSTVHEQAPTEIRRLLERVRARRAVVVYAFGTDAVVRRLERPPLMALRSPVAPGELALALCAGAAAPVVPVGDEERLLHEPVPPRRFGDRELARISAVSPTIRCECPHHLADLIAGLNAFERYSSECESLSPEDAAIHAYLHRVTARARAMMETALERLARAEGLLDGSDDGAEAAPEAPGEAS
jgi:DNA-binding transcriptional MerR regulator